MRKAQSGLINRFYKSRRKLTTASSATLGMTPWASLGKVVASMAPPALIKPIL